MAYSTASAILLQAAAELGLTAPQSIPSTEALTNQLHACLNAAGNDIVAMYQWPSQVATWNFTTVPNQALYPLPADWLYFLNSTGWDGTAKQPLDGPKTPQAWAAAMNSATPAVFRRKYRVVGGQLAIHPTPSDAAPLSITYCKNTWVLGQNNTAQDRAFTGSDVVQLNPWLITKLVKVKFQELAGFDSTLTRADFTRYLASVIGKEDGGQVLALVQPRNSGFLGYFNVPDGYWVT